MTQISPELDVRASEPEESKGRTISARRAQTRQRLLEAAVNVFAERGVIGSSVEEICEAAGFTRGAFYSNFADKSALVLALIRDRMDTQFAAAAAAVQGMKSSSAPIEEAIGRTLDTVFSTRAGDDAGVLADREVLLHAVRDPDLRAPYLAFVASCRAQVGDLVTDALDHLGLELTIPLDHAIALLIATHEHQQLAATLERRPVNGAVLRSLLFSISRPATTSTVVA